MEKGQFRWELLGTPDYSECARIVASLPELTRNSLRPNDERLLTHIFFICWVQASHSGRGAAYASPGQQYLGKSINRSRWSVARGLKRLRSAGVLSWFRRRPRNGAPQSNMYSLGKRLLAVIYAIASKKLQRNHHGAKMPHNDLKKREEPSTVGGQRDSIRFLPATRGLERLPAQGALAFSPLSEDKRQTELAEGRAILAKFGLIRPS